MSFSLLAASLPVEGVHAQAGVVGHRHEKARLGLCSASLYEGVVKERLPVLHGIGEVAQLAESHKAHARHDGREDCLDLHDLVRVARGHHDGGGGVELTDCNL